ncbi:unnamed protein product [Heligmosomoides polygyrus]|uniref:Rib_recp_KP_reg domain-containing protein n=1 Tax=Heligmosomoides polygyrus TaxID=6339 RepID=A0A3P8AII7_HELPZ|nr:unnamed protein product [Heligmosomoides polygyrus]
MLDPFTLGCILAVVAGVIAIVFYLFSGTDDERDFEKAFGENARKLLNQDREKHKSKVKLSKKKEGREKRTEAKHEPDLEGEPVITPSDAAADPVDPVQTSASNSLTDITPPEPKSKKSVKKDKSSAAGASETEDVTAELAVVTAEEPASLIETPVDENKENRSEHTSSSEGKRKKKIKTKKEEDSAISESIQPEISTLENSVVEFERKDLELKKKIDQYQQSRVISDRQIADHMRVISELTSKLQALAVSEAASKQQIVQLNNVRVENDTLKAALSKSAAEAAAAAKAISSLEAMKVSHAELTERLSQTTKTLNETTEENAALKREIAEISEACVFCLYINGEGKHWRNLIQKQLVQSYMGWWTWDQSVALEQLKQEFATLDSAARHLKAELEDKTRVIEETNLMASNTDSAKRAEGERDEIAHQFTQARCEWEKKEAALMNEYTSLKNLVDELNKEVAKFEQLSNILKGLSSLLVCEKVLLAHVSPLWGKKEQDELEQKLLAKEAELAEKSARLEAAETEKQVLVVQGNGRSIELESENAELRKRLADLENMLSEVRKSHSDVLTELAEVRATANKQVVEVSVLQKSQPVDASGMNSVDLSESEAARLRSENERLQKKNEELRKRNFKILDDVAVLERQLQEGISKNATIHPKPEQVKHDTCRAQLLEERELVASAIGSIVNSPLDKDTSYAEYVNELGNSLKSVLNDVRTHQAGDEADTSSATLEELTHYKSAFNSLAVLLSQIELGVDEREAFYKEKVAQLERELDKANGVIASANRLRKELRECEFLKKQIHALRKCLGQPEDEKKVDSPRNCTAKSDESDWEVVSR